MEYPIFLHKITHIETFSWENQTPEHAIDCVDMFQDWFIKDKFCEPSDFYIWIYENSSNDWKIIGIPHKNTITYFIFFVDQVDATAFKLRWL